MDVGSDVVIEVRCRLARAAAAATDAALTAHQVDQDGMGSGALSGACTALRQRLDAFAVARTQQAAELPSLLDAVASVDGQNAQELQRSAYRAGLNL